MARASGLAPLSVGLVNVCGFPMFLLAWFHPKALIHDEGKGHGFKVVYKFLLYGISKTYE